ncbi:MAG TPA: hypothetical protein VMW80_04725 [Candidatus Dormibacteraeota bacterium]|nr:hypothetical protein [Candidatus Dormibacteraeota bacterium]
MPGLRLDSARRQFQDRVLTQLRSRFPGWEFSAREDDFGVLARKERAQVAFSLDSLYAEVSRPKASLPEEISRFVSTAGPRLSAAEQHPEQTGPAPDPGALVWCVRTERSLRAYSRFAELATRELPGGLLAFVAESLPGDAMRGVSRVEAEAGGLDEAALERHADHNTSLRLTHWSSELEAAQDERSWLFTDDILFSSSLLLVPAFLERLGQLGQGQVAVAAPDRAMVVAGVGDKAAAETMLPLVRRLYRLASFPLSPVLLTTDGRSLALHPAETTARHAKTGWRRLFGSAEA